MKAYSYLRFSEPRQQWGDSERRQAKLAEDYCRRRGLTLDESLQLIDRGKSGFHSANLSATGKLAEFLKAIESEKVRGGDVLIVENLDRLTRAEFSNAIRLFLGILESGVEIVTLSPERSYTKRAVNEDVSVIMGAVMSLFLGHEESRKKSERVLEEWRERFKRVDSEKITARCPAWLRLPKRHEDGDRSKFKVRPEAATIVRQIFRWAIDGVGVHKIARRLNQKGIPCIGGRKDKETGKPLATWHYSYVRKILGARSVYGEFQSYTGRGVNRKPFGDPIPHYYPLVVSKAEFNRAQAAIATRVCHRGPVGKYVANLFTGILFDARDRSPMTLNQKIGGNRSIVSRSAHLGVAGSVYLAFPYQLVEDAILTFLEEIDPAELVARRKVDPTSLLQSQKDDIDDKISKLQARFDATADDALLDMIVNYRAKLKPILERLHEMKPTKRPAVEMPTAAREFRSLVRLLKNCPAGELEDLRMRLKAKILQLVDEVWICVAEGPIVGSRGRIFKGRYACIQLFFANGARRFVIIGTTLKGRSVTARPSDPEAEKHDLRKSEFDWFEKMVTRPPEGRKALPEGDYAFLDAADGE